MLQQSAGFENLIEMCTGIYFCQGDYKADHKLAFQKVWTKQKNRDGSIARPIITLSTPKS